MLSVINQQFIEAAQNNQLDELKKLLNQGADIHTDDDEALIFSATRGHLEVVKFLVLPDIGAGAIANYGNIHYNNDEYCKSLNGMNITIHKDKNKPI